MFGFDVFAEVMVVGGLLLLALTPIFVRLSPWASKRGDFLPAVDYLKEGTGRYIIALFVAYALGVAGNRLGDDLLDAMRLDPGSEYKQLYRDWAKSYPLKPPELKYAEFWLRERSEATAGWFDRHKSFVRILRGAAVACALLLLTMLVYRLSRPPTPRYTRIHFASTTVLLLLFLSAYYLETAGYQKRVYELSRYLPEAKK